MKVRIGVGLGPHDDFIEAIDHAEQLGIDSLWFSEVVFGEHADPFIAMAYALSRTTKLKVGTGVAVLPGRSPVLVAKQVATLAALAPKRVLPVFGLRPARTPERQVFPAPRGERGALFDETMVVVRQLLTQESVTFQGRFHTLDNASVRPRPKRMDIWLGGSARAGLERTGRLADGWLGSFLTPGQALLARRTVEAAAREAGREIEADHYGISIALAEDGIPPALAQAARSRQPNIDPAEVVPGSWEAAQDLIERYIEAGLTKFVIRPAGEVRTIRPFLDDFAAKLKPLERNLGEP
ncbi:TIGR03854 family LLM class F420-dependent oxidoreductase [Kibdelosporangium phytohabitans]|uniref:5,10-methylene tetrahydromethanopterin reductase n=1 Tax=Kibdelosporangium phytohabitans TaxID=860235 RepID=A0A0N9HXU3_9PSEU|nr:TIGR03854 family LLM class F420-dependent oxidoreductase [Kibdelosporangium phytohabitans]ALG07083.1 5,10-methylene tetrahydromethanopterin reductase [Kibdelosporangium phytohabitans]MBE1468392.1 putative F420-dependent oxidoreductase [Kibdelosporangium phytohabitans]